MSLRSGCRSSLLLAAGRIVAAPPRTAPSRSAAALVFGHALLFGALFTGCTSGPDLARRVEVRPGQPTVLTWITPAGQPLSLQNESAAAAAEVYSSGGNVMRKIVPDSELQTLLDVFAEQGLFDRCVASAPPDARELLQLEQPGRSWVWARRGSEASPTEQAFASGRGYFMAVYNSNVAYHSDQGRTDFRAEALRAESSSNAARRRLQRAGSQSGGSQNDGSSRP